MNKMLLIGWLVADPKIISSEGKKTVAYFRVASRRNFKQEGEPDTDYFSCVTFGKLAEFLGEYFHKGKKISLWGEMRNDNYTNDKNEKVYGMRLIATEIESPENKEKSETGGQKRSANSSNASRTLRNSQSNVHRQSSQRSSYQNSPYYPNRTQTTRTGNTSQRTTVSQQSSRGRYDVDEKFMNTGNEAMDFC